MNTHAANNWIVETVKSLNLPSDQYAVFGSGLLDVLGLKKAGDIDLVVTKKLFDVLSTDEQWQDFTYPDSHLGLKHRTKNIELFYEADMPFCDETSIVQMIRDAVVVDGVKFVRLEDILVWKKAFGREKDLWAVELIEAYMKEQQL